MCTVPRLLFIFVYLWGILSVLWWTPGVGWISALWCWSCPVLSSALSVWMEQCASTASLLASVREQERQFEMLSRALEEERRSCAGTLPRPLPNMQVTWIKPPFTYPHAHSSIDTSIGFTLWSEWSPRSSPSHLCGLAGCLQNLNHTWEQKYLLCGFQSIKLGLICVDIRVEFRLNFGSLNLKPKRSEAFLRR